MAERQSDRMSKITKDGLARSGTGCFTALQLPIWQQWASKGLKYNYWNLTATYSYIYSVSQKIPLRRPEFFSIFFTKG